LNEEMTKRELKALVAKVMEISEHDVAVKFIDDIKSLGFEFVTKSGISWGMEDLSVPVEKQKIIDEAEEKVEVVKQQYNMGLLTEEERKIRVIEIWNDAKNTITDLVRGGMDKEGP